MDRTVLSRALGSGLRLGPLSGCGKQCRNSCTTGWSRRGTCRSSLQTGQSAVTAGYWRHPAVGSAAPVTTVRRRLAPSLHCYPLPSSVARQLSAATFRRRFHYLTRRHCQRDRCRRRRYSEVISDGPWRRRFAGELTSGGLIKLPAGRASRPTCSFPLHSRLLACEVSC